MKPADDDDRASYAPLQLLSRALLISGMLAATPLPIISASAGDDGPVVSTADGRVRGIVKNGVNIFLGIPYAAPPVGDLRWRPPAPARKWQGTLDATAYGSTCPQVTEFGAFAGPSSVTEDCLHLNVFTTGATGKKKPVIVWIHGGGNIDGESNDYDGSRLATGGPGGEETVVVTINYRLGLLGFISNPALNAEGHPWGNYGILDQQAALRWVQRNIAAFGGDPANVTLGGQSAGTRDTEASLFSPLAKGLFHRAILESYPEMSWATADTMLVSGTAFAEAAGCPGTTAAAAACLRQLSAARILQLQGTPAAQSPFAAPIGVFPDGTIVPVQPGVAWTTGQFQRMPILVGLVHDEANFGIGITEYFSGQPPVPMTAAQYQAAVSSATLAQYPLTSYGNNPQLAFDRASTDPIACTTLHVLQLIGPRTPTYGYEFTYQSAPYYFPKMPGFHPLAAHTIDIQFLFPGYHGGNLGVNLDPASGLPRSLDAQETQFSDQLVAAWTKFARYGNPNGAGNAPWPQFTGSAPALLQENIPSTPYSAAQFYADHKCDYWFPALGF
jgi:para-nitrobenzyl esterase